MKQVTFIVLAFVLLASSCKKNDPVIVKPGKIISLENTSWIYNDDRATVITFYKKNIYYKKSNEITPYTLSHDTLYLPSNLYPNFTVNVFGDSLIMYGFKDPLKPTLRYSRL